MPQVLGKRIPQAWLDVLSTIQAIYPQAVLTGGALRDLVFDGEVKDLDFFVPYSDQVYLTRTPQGWTRDDAASVPRDYTGSMRGEVALVEGFKVPNVPTVQIIHLSIRTFSYFTILNRMDFTACRIATDGREVYFGPGALHDLENGLITLARCEDLAQAKRSLRRAERFRQRYGNRVVVDTSAADRWFVKEVA